jgi:LAO/AO transport system kinase
LKRPPTPPAAPRDSSAALASRIRRGDTAAAARAITLLENGDPGADELLRRLYRSAGRAWCVGVTGPPGVGKSTLVGELVARARRKARRVGALLVDPSSPYSGGAVLGDRLRLGNAEDRGVFVRSLASRGAVGGLSAAVWGARRVMDALGAEVVVVETVGAGQADVEVASCADSVAVVLMPGQGDEVQALKAGILEIADVLVVNKADHPDRDRTVAALRSLWSPPAPARGAAWARPLLTTVATRGDGVDAVWRALLDHRAHLRRSGEGKARRRLQARAELLGQLRREWDRSASASVEREVSRLVARTTDPVSASRRLLAARGRRR